jgi:hypothetical protein
MRIERLFNCILATFVLIVIFLPGSLLAFENVNMGTTITVQDGQIVAHWSTGGFDHYNIRWSANGGPAAQVERDGNKDFVFLTGFQSGVVYSISVQGCDKGLVGSSTCTSWEEAQCGSARNPCTGPMPMPIVSSGGLCLDVNAPDQHVNGGRVQVWACNGSDQQRWTIEDGRVVSLAGKCLDANLAELQKDGGKVQIWDCNGSTQQRWRMQGRELRNGGGKCLDVNLPQLHQNGGTVQIWECNQSPQQSWSQPSTF